MQKTRLPRFTPVDPSVTGLSPYSAPGVVVGTGSVALTESLVDKLAAKLEGRYHIKAGLIKQHTRKGPVVYVRHMLIYWLKKRYRQATLIQLGELLGGRDHTTIMYSITTFQNRLDTDANVPDLVASEYLKVREDYSETSKYLLTCLTEPMDC